MDDNNGPNRLRELAAAQNLIKKHPSSVQVQTMQTPNTDETGFTTFTIPPEKPQTSLYEGSTPDEGHSRGRSSPGAVGQLMPPFSEILPLGPQTPLSGGSLPNQALSSHQACLHHTQASQNHAASAQMTTPSGLSTLATPFNKMPPPTFDFIDRTATRPGQKPIINGTNFGPFANQFDGKHAFSPSPPPSHLLKTICRN